MRRNGACAPRGAPTLITHGHEHASRFGSRRSPRNRHRHQSFPAVGQGGVLLRESAQPILARPQCVAARRCAAGAGRGRSRGARRTLRDRLHRHRETSHRRQRGASCRRVSRRCRAPRSDGPRTRPRRRVVPGRAGVASLRPSRGTAHRRKGRLGPAAGDHRPSPDLRHPQPEPRKRRLRIAGAGAVVRTRLLRPNSCRPRDLRSSPVAGILRRDEDHSAP